MLWEENSQNPRSIASITKVMTAEVVLEDNPDLTREVVVERSDVTRANHTYLRAGERVTIDDLLHLTLIASDNAAARALARTSPLGTDGFIRRMNDESARAGLATDLVYGSVRSAVDNVSSAFDMARLIVVASSDERVASIMRMPYYTVLTNRRVINIHSTNQLVVKGDVDVRAGKTGFISKAGVLPGDAAPACRSPAIRSPSSSSARARTPDASWRPVTCSTGSARRPPA